MSFHYFVLTVILFPLVGLAKPPQLNVYVYDSFQGKETLGDWLKQTSVQETGCETKYTVFATAGEALNQVVLEKSSPRADIVVGVDQTLLSRARQIGGFESLSLLEDQIQPELLFDKQHHWLPFDYGFPALVYDDRRVALKPGMTFESFSSNPSFRKRLVLEDPRASTLGKSLLLWTHELFPEASKREALWTALLGQTLTIVPGWSAAYGLFLSGEADFVLSYSTSPAYHMEKEKQAHIRAVLFPEGHYRQIEGVGIRSTSSQKVCALKWVKQLVSKSVQTKLPLLQWMYPAAKGITLPAVFRRLPRPKALSMGVSEINDADLQRWTALAAGLK